MSLELSKSKSFGIALEGFLIWVVSWILGEFFAISLAEMNPDMPLISAEMITSPGISPLMAIGYMWLRLRYIPIVMVNQEVFLGTCAGILLAWLVTFMGVLFLGREVSLAQEILKTRHSPYFYPTLFLFVAWGPFLEETLARGYFFELLRRSWGDPAGLVVSSFLFVIFHAIFGGVGLGLLFIFLWSVILTIVYMQSGLIASILTHMFVNFYLTYLNM